MGTGKQEVKLQGNIGDQVLQDGRLHTAKRERETRDMIILV